MADCRGGVAVIVALVLPVLLGVSALAVETGLWFSQRRVLQNAADAAALSGAFELTAGRQSSVVASALADGRQNAASADFVVRTPPLAGGYAGNSRAVEVVASRGQRLILAGLFVDAATVSARAVAVAGSLGDACILALDRVESSAAEFTGSADIVLNNCGVKANSASAQALTVSGSASLTARFIETVGGYDVSGSGRLSVQTTLTNAAATTDPYLSLPKPAGGACTKTSYKQNGQATLSPGIYCNGMDIQSQAVVTLLPGVYVIQGGSLAIHGGATFTGDGVTLYLAGSGGSYAQVDINGNAHVSLRAPTSGDYAGVLFAQDRNAPIGGDNKFNGGATMSLNGALYFPSQQVDFQGNTGNGGGCTRIIAHTVTFTGNATLGNACDAQGIATSSGGMTPSLVE